MAVCSGVSVGVDGSSVGGCAGGWVVGVWLRGWLSRCVGGWAQAEDGCYLCLSHVLSYGLFDPHPIPPLPPSPPLPLLSEPVRSLARDPPLGGYPQLVSCYGSLRGLGLGGSPGSLGPGWTPFASVQLYCFIGLETRLDR